MRLSAILYILVAGMFTAVIITGSSGCAQVGAPTGGPKDTLAPKLLNASPPSGTTNFTGNKITLTFDEYVEVKETQTNVLVSPLPRSVPGISYKLKTVTVRLRDSLQPNTTYAINFGSAISDINENNPLKDFTYVFSTGNTIDSLTLGGKVIMAETGTADSTLSVLLYRNANDSSVQKRRPDYMAKLKGDGSFLFRNLPPGNFSIYALKDGDGSRTYNSKTEQFGFTDKPVTVSAATAPVTLYAYAEEKDRSKDAPPAKATDKKLRYTPGSELQDLENNYTITFNKPLKKFDPAGIVLTDTSYIPVAGSSVVIDSTRTAISLINTWKEGEPYRIIINKEAISDSADNTIFKSDTIRFSAKRTSDYGNLVLRFSNADLSKHPVIQFVQNNEVKASYPITGNEWNKKLFNPGEYTIRILFDANNNGKWDPGSYSKKRQPEKVITLSQKVAIRANWDNERDIRF